MHSKTNYPAKKSISDLDVELENNLEDAAYIRTLKFYLNELNKENFDFVFYIAGVDIHLNDRLGKLNISDDGVRKEMISNQNFLSKKIPFCGVLRRTIIKILVKELHSILHQTCAKFI